MALGDWPVSGVTVPTIYRYTAPAVSTVVTSTTVYLSSIWLANITGAAISFTLTSGDGTTAICPSIEVPPLSHYSESIPFRQCVGIRSYADAGTGLTVQLQVH